MFIRHEDSYRDKRVVIVGVGNTACDAAVDLSSVCSQVTSACEYYTMIFIVRFSWVGQLNKSVIIDYSVARRVGQKTSSCSHELSFVINLPRSAAAQWMAIICIPEVRS